METKTLFFLGIVWLLSSCFSRRVHAAPYNITQVLEKYSDYSQFNQLLTASGLAQKINAKERTITVLVVNNGGVGSLSGKPAATVQAVLSLHIILDYIDNTKIKSMNRTTFFTTMYQETGNAKDDQGFVNATKTSDNDNQLMFGNGKEKAQLSVNYKKIVTTKPSLLSVVEVSSVIQAPWADNLKAPPPGSPQKAPSSSPNKAPAPSPRSRKLAPPSDSPPAPDTDADASPTQAPGKNSASLHATASGFAASLAIGLLASVFITSF